MQIELNENLRLISDDKNWIISEKRNDKNKGIVYNAKLFFPTLDYALEEILEMKLLENEATSMLELIEHYKQTKKEITELIEKLYAKIRNIA